MTDFAIPLHVHPGYVDTAVLDDARATDFARLDREGHVYLD